MKQKTPFILFSILIILWGLNTLAGVFDLYYMFDWYDIMMHMIGGVILALMMIMLMRKSVFFSRLTVHQKILIIIVWGFIGGIFWELFEYVQDIYLGTSLQVSWGDTLSDLLCDTIGATFVAIIYWYNRKL